MVAVPSDQADGSHEFAQRGTKAFMAFMAFIAFIACCSQVPKAMAQSKPASHESTQHSLRMCHQAGKVTKSPTPPRDSLQQPGNQFVQHACPVPGGPSLPSCSSSRELPRYPPFSSWPVAKASTDCTKRSFTHHETLALLMLAMFDGGV